MSFELGHRKLGGRKKGVSNKLSNELRDLLRGFIEKEAKELPKLFSSIKSPEKRLELIIKLLPFVLTKAQEISLELLSDNKIDFLVETLTYEAKREN